MEELTGFGMKKSSTLPSLENKYFDSLRDENYEPIYTYNDEYMRHFARKSIKGGRCTTLNQYFKSTVSDEVFNIMSQEIGVIGNICEILDEHFEYTNKHRKKLEDEYDSQFGVYRDTIQEGRIKHNNDKLSKLPKLKQLQQLDDNDAMMDFNATSLYGSAIRDEKSIHPEIEIGFDFKSYMNKTYLDAFNNQSFN